MNEKTLLLIDIVIFLNPKNEMLFLKITRQQWIECNIESSQKWIHPLIGFTVMCKSLDQLTLHYLQQNLYLWKNKEFFFLVYITLCVGVRNGLDQYRRLNCLVTFALVFKYFFPLLMKKVYYSHEENIMYLQRKVVISLSLKIVSILSIIIKFRNEFNERKISLFTRKAAKLPSLKKFLRS